VTCLVNCALPISSTAHSIHPPFRSMMRAKPICALLLTRRGGEEWECRHCSLCRLHCYAAPSTRSAGPLAAAVDIYGAKPLSRVLSVIVHLPSRLLQDKVPAQLCLNQQRQIVLYRSTCSVALDSHGTSADAWSFPGGNPHCSAMATAVISPLASNGREWLPSAPEGRLAFANAE